MPYHSASIRPALALAFAMTLAVSGCGGGGGGGGGTDATPSDTVAHAPIAAPESASSDIALGTPSAGATPFISFLPLQGTSLAQVSTFTYTVQAQPGTASRPVTVTYSATALAHRGYMQSNSVRLPIFGLYADYENAVDVEVAFEDGSVQDLTTSIRTAAYHDPAGIFNRPTLLKARSADAALGFDYFAIKTLTGPTVVVDTDGTIRWVGTGFATTAVAYRDGGFIVGSMTSPQVQRIELDGTLTTSTLTDPLAKAFAHNIDIGKTGLLVDVDTTTNIESTVEEMNPSGEVTRIWDLAEIIANYMRAHGDDPSNFVRQGNDWFHLNAATYDPRDDSLIVSSRENFVMKLDYATGEPLWILGDTTKYWATFPSLRAKALQLAPGGLVPIGQHAVSITPDGLLMLFNDGQASVNNPLGTPAGLQRPYSAVSAYAIDAQAMTATEVWDYDASQTLASPFCSSAYDAGDGSVLVDYALAAGGTATRLVGLNPQHQVVFDLSFPNSGGCQTGWNAVPVPLDHLQILQ